MNRSLIDILSAGNHSARFELLEFATEGSDIDYGVLRCPETGYARMVLAGFPLFCEAIPVPDTVDLPMLQAQEQEQFGDSREYQHFIEEKWRRPNRDAYAAFQPFNESTRALYALVPLLREYLRPGDYILDTWCRTGWTGELLAALFPQQQIVSIWEGNHGALGYQAFRHWLARGKRAPNLDILFHDVNQPLPFTSGSFGAVIGLDTLHRYDADALLPECVRVCRDDAPILFPHVHLTNSEPDPWFERGYRQEHGRVWNDYLEHFAKGSERAVYIESEMTLFGASPEIMVANNPSCSHYNALVALVPHAWMGKHLAGIDNHFAVDDASYVIVNPLLNVDLHRLRVTLHTDDSDGMTAYMLARHPGYAAYLTGRLSCPLTAEQARVLYWANKCMPLGYIADRLGKVLPEIQQLLAPLQAADIVQILPISSGMAQLNHYFSQQQVVVSPDEQNLGTLWQQAVLRHGDRIYITSVEDELELTYTEFNDLVDLTARRLLSELPQADMALCVAAHPNLETVVLFWAAQRIGRLFVSVDSAWSPARILELAQRQRFKLLFTNVEIPGDIATDDTSIIVFESDAATTASYTRFDEWVEDEAVVDLPTKMPHPASTAVILFTSGTTGHAKGVELSHRAMWQSARNVARWYDWKPEDVFLSIGNYATVSGVRNSLIATASTGCRLLIPNSTGRAGILEAFTMIGNYDVTIFGTVPAYISRLAALAQRLDPASCSTLRAIMSSGSTLDSEAAGVVEDHLGVPVYNFYGLTETSGACIFMPGSARDASPYCIGLPVDAIAQVVTPEGRIADDGEEGELRIYSGNLLSRYLGEPTASHLEVHDGWLYSGDIGHWSESGLIELRGRKREVIKAASGEMVYLAEVEQCLLRHTDIPELAVAGFVDEYGDDRMACFVPASTKAAHEALLQHFNAVLRTTLSQHHQLTSVVTVETFPRGANEKIQRSELSRLYLRTTGDIRE